MSWPGFGAILRRKTWSVPVLATGALEFPYLPFNGDARVTPGKAKDPDARQIDLDEVARLIEALERDLNKIQGGSKDIQRLKDEVDTLKNVLRSPVRRHHWVRDALHDIRERFDDALDAAVAEGIEAGRYVAEIGRILGL